MLRRCRKRIVMSIDGIGITAQLVERDTPIVMRNRMAGRERQSPVGLLAFATLYWGGLDGRS